MNEIEVINETIGIVGWGVLIAFFFSLILVAIIISVSAGWKGENEENE
jgi:hypothetical protein